MCDLELLLCIDILWTRFGMCCYCELDKANNQTIDLIFSKLSLVFDPFFSGEPVNQTAGDSTLGHFHLHGLT